MENKKKRMNGDSRDEPNALRMKGSLVGAPGMARMPGELIRSLEAMKRHSLGLRVFVLHCL